MKVIIQRVKEANVQIDNEIVGKINKGYLLYVCFEKEDTLTNINASIKKIRDLRIFEDQAGKMNTSLLDANGEVLSISQFTLSWDGKKGNRPSFDKSMHPDKAEVLYNKFNELLKQNDINVQTGCFGANMQVQSINDGPVTFYLTF